MDGSVIDCIGVVKSPSVVAETSDDNEDDDDVKTLSDIVDFVGKFNELCVGNRIW